MRYFADLQLDETHTLGPREITEADSLRFCQEFDRLPIHLDQRYASQTLYGELIASGLHTLSLTASIVVDGFLKHTAMIGASGMEHVRWHRPVTLPNKLSVTVTILNKSPPQPGKAFGVVSCKLETTDRNGHRVMTATVNYLMGTGE